jgi:hypothetical protein
LGPNIKPKDAPPAVLRKRRLFMVSLIALASMFPIAGGGAEYVTYEGEYSCKQRANNAPISQRPKLRL